jgi:hypothetical protein
VHPVREGYSQLYGSGSWANVHAASAIPALAGIKHDRRLPLLRIRKEDVHLTDLDAQVAAVAALWFKRQGIEERGFWRDEHFLCPHC